MSKNEKNDKDNKEKDLLGVDISQIKDIKELIQAYFDLLEFMVGKENKEIVEMHLTKDSNYIVVKLKDIPEDEDTEWDFEWI